MAKPYEPPFLLLDHNLRILYWNSEASRKFGAQIQNSIGQSLNFLVPGWKRPDHLLYISVETDILFAGESDSPHKTILTVWQSSDQNFYFANFQDFSKQNQSFLKSETLELQHSHKLPSDIQKAYELALEEHSKNVGATSSYPSELQTEEMELQAGDELLRKISLVNLLQQVAAAANEANDIGSLLQFTVDRVCAVAQWKLGHVYLWSEEKDRLEIAPIWYSAPEESIRAIKSRMGKEGKHKGSNLGDRALRQKKTVWVEDIRNEMDFEYSDILINAGILGAYATPIWVREKIVGVLEFYSQSDLADPSWIEALSHIGSQIGRVFERKIAEDNLRNSREQLRALSARLQKVREEERLLIAREIHDELGQLLTVLKIDLTLLRQSHKVSSPKDMKLLEELKSMSKVADTAIDSIQRIATELRPMILDDLGLFEGIEWYARDFQKRTGIVCEVSVDADSIPPDRERAIALFRIFQETLTNVVRHSKATVVRVSIRDEESFLILTISDNGVGIRQAELADSRSLGLIGIKERAIVLGGETNIFGEPGKGTIVRAKIPRGENKIPE